MTRLRATLVLGPVLTALAAGQRLAPDGLDNGAGFGWSVDLDAHGQLCVGAPFAHQDGELQAGCAFVYQRREWGWEFRRRIRAQNPQADDHYGYDVGIDDSWVVAGAPKHGATTGRGFLRLYRRNAQETWDPHVTLSSPLGSGDDEYGSALSIWGSDLWVGACKGDLAGVDSGGVYVYRYGVLGWEAQQVLVAPDTSAGDFLGFAVDLEGERGLIGAYGDDTLGTNVGAVWYLERTGGQWVFVERLLPSDGVAHFRWGSRVALSGDLAVVGHPEDDDAGVDAGAVYVFERIGGTWVEVAKLFASDASAGDALGISVDVQGEVLVAGASLHDGSGAQSGAAVVFERSDGVWTEIGLLSAPDAQAYDYQGQACAIEGDEVVLGAWGDDREGSAVGATYRFDRAAWGVPWAKPYCFCASGAPCGNFDPEAGCANASTEGGRLDWFGSPSLLADDLVLHAVDLPPVGPALAFVGDRPALATLGDGHLCIGSDTAPMGRFFAVPVVAGSAQFGPGLIAYSIGAFPPAGQFLPGGTWYFQVWFRDPAGPCGSGVGLTNALAVTFAG